MDEKTAYKLLEEKTSEGVVEIDEHGIITWVNDAAARTMKYSRSDMVGKRYLDFVHPAYSKEAAEIYESVLNSEGSDAQVIEFVVPVVGEDNKMIYAEIRFSAVEDERGSRYVVAFIRDRTNEYLLLRKLDALCREYGVLVDSLRNGLAAIKGYSEILEEEGLLPPEKRKEILEKLPKIVLEEMTEIERILGKIDQTWEGTSQVMKELREVYMPVNGREEIES